MAKCKSCGSGGMLAKLTSTGLCLSCASQTIERLNALLTPELQEVLDASTLLDEKRRELAALDSRICEKKNDYDKLLKDVERMSQHLIVADEIIELESFSLYTPRYAFATSDEYKARLDSIRDQQKQLIKDGKAATCATEWKVGGSAADGRKFIAEMVKLFLRSFNNECDIAISDVKFSNYDRCVTRIEKSFETINKLGRINTVSISVKYKALKLEELALAYEYQCKKQEEKEALQAMRAQQREEAKLAKEIAEARKEAEKERKHYQQALESLKAQLAKAATDEERAALEEKQNELINHLDDLNEKMEDIDYRQSNQRAGYVYVISNIGSFGEGVYKIGMTRRLDPMERVYELGDASVPFMFDIHAMIFSDDAPKLEAALHQAFADRRVNMVNARREYFRVSLDEIKKVVRQNHDKTVEFTDVAVAQQYRESQLMAKLNGGTSV